MLQMIPVNEAMYLKYKTSGSFSLNYGNKSSYQFKKDNRVNRIILVHIEGDHHLPIGSMVYTISKSEDILKLTDITISPDMRGRGYGKLALTQLDEIARKREVTAIKLFVFDTREVAKALYTQMGFVTFRKYKNGQALIKYLNE